MLFLLHHPTPHCATPVHDAPECCCICRMTLNCFGQRPMSNVSPRHLRVSRLFRCCTSQLAVCPPRPPPISFIPPNGCRRRFVTQFTANSPALPAFVAHLLINFPARFASSTHINCPNRVACRTEQQGFNISIKARFTASEVSAGGATVL